jgi:hypothetical protein
MIILSLYIIISLIIIISPIIIFFFSFISIIINVSSLRLALHSIAIRAHQRSSSLDSDTGPTCAQAPALKLSPTTCGSPCSPHSPTRSTRTLASHPVQHAIHPLYAVQHDTRQRTLSLPHSIIHSIIHSRNHSLIHAITSSLDQSQSRSLARSLTHSLTCPSKVVHKRRHAKTWIHPLRFHSRPHNQYMLRVVRHEY